jgi:SAP domain-containing protein
LSRKTTLSASMTVRQFDHGYWYATELKHFAKGLGIPSASRLRKDELERAIRMFLKTGTIAQSPNRKLSAPRERDVARGLHLDLLVVSYSNDGETKEFLEQEARKLVPGFKRRSGVRYRLNRWREAQILSGVKLTYGDLVKEYVRLNQSTERFAQVPQVRYINFMSDFLAAETGATKQQAIKAWSILKSMDVPKTYSAWVRARSRKLNLGARRY